ncbi:hypothetical protein CH370_17960 [Leptospira kmetyi]|uniref:acyltransferase family protein n=1 Tax=Leptospira kmetyi TaxID=408139 RepID=UPI000C2A6A6B|nr:acyltransferase [Leptospira kmetyi]PJZ40047.1 hypothetical protein CH370_17960 [Leptospira kmetyi]
MKTKLYSIQILRAIAAISVAIFHLTAIEKKYSVNSPILPDIFKVGQSGVDLFFVISGFIMVILTFDSWGEKNSLKFILRRVSRIYPVYWFYLLITFMIFLIKPEWVNNSQNNQFDLFASILLYPSNKLPLVMVAWSLTFELYFYLVFSAIIRFKKRYVILVLISWCIFLVIVNTWIEFKSNNPFYQLFTSPYSIEFIIGAFSGILFKISDKKLKVSKLVMALAIATISVPFCYKSFYGNLFYQCTIFGLLYGIIIYAVVKTEQSIKINFPKPAILLGDCSYSVYLSHILVLSAIGKFWASFAQLHLYLIGNILFIIISLFAVTIYSYLSYRFIEKKSYEFLRNTIEKI